MSDIKNLTTRQRKAITALLTSANVAQAAKKAGVSERSIYRYLAEESFKQALLDAESEAIYQATRRLVGLQGLAIETLEEVLRDKAEKSSVRLKAATNVLDYLLKLRELRNVEERLAALEGQGYEAMKTPEEWKAEREKRLEQAERTLADFEDEYS